MTRFHISTYLSALLIAASGVSACASPPPPMAQSGGKPLDISPLVQEVDVNKDGCMSAEEWFGKSLPRSAYDMLKDERGCVTHKAMTTTPAPGDIDMNGDGKLTVSEMVAYDKKGPPAGPPPQQ
ncbi:MAG: hypothetical protein QM645_01870 [Asticcacaulis sp.]